MRASLHQKSWSMRSGSSEDFHLHVFGYSRINWYYWQPIVSQYLLNHCDISHTGNCIGKKMTVLLIGHFCCAYFMYCVALLQALVLQNPPSNIPTLDKQTVVSFSLDFSLDLSGKIRTPN